MATVRRVRALVLLVAVALLPSPIHAQQSKSQSLASELTRMLDARKLDSVAARSPTADEYVGALYFPGSQLLVVWAKYASPDRMRLLLDNRHYREAYIDLNSASLPDTKVFVSDLGADGLRFDREGNRPWDTVDLSNRSVAFDGDWNKAKISRDEYTKLYQSTDEQYARMLEALIAELKKSS